MLDWNSEAEVSSILLLLKNLLPCSNHLERLVLCNADSECVLKASSQIGDFTGRLCDGDGSSSSSLPIRFPTPTQSHPQSTSTSEERNPSAASGFLALSGWWTSRRKDTRIPRVHYDESSTPSMGSTLLHSNFNQFMISYYFRFCLLNVASY